MRNKLAVLLLLLFATGGILMGQSAMPDPFSKPEYDLRKTTLKKRDLVAYQKRANEKVEEFFQYMEIMADNDHNDAVRDRAQQIAEKQFDPSAKILSGNKVESVKEYVARYRQSTQYKSLDVLEVTQPLSPNNSGNFKGKVRVEYSLMDSKKELPNPETGSEEFTIFLMRQEKSFGSSRQVVWELYLGGITGE